MEQNLVSYVQDPTNGGSATSLQPQVILNGVSVNAEGVIHSVTTNDHQFESSSQNGATVLLRKSKSRGIFKSLFCCWGLSTRSKQTAVETIRDSAIQLYSPTAWYHRERSLLRDFYWERPTKCALAVVEEYADQLHAEKMKRVELFADMTTVMKELREMIEFEDFVRRGRSMRVTPPLRDLFEKYTSDGNGGNPSCFTK